MVLPNNGFPYCRMFNPGEDAVFLTDFYGDGTLRETRVDGDLLSPKARRTYKALELFWDGSWDRTFVQASYTLAYSKGNTEGGVKSDIGQDDTNVTQDFDYKELTVYHGGIHPYGSSFFRCGTTEAGGAEDENGDPAPARAVPRGTAGRLPWTKTVDLSFAYTPNWAAGLMMKVDVFNVFNEQETLAVEERAEDAATGTPAGTYLVPRAYQQPRYWRFMLQYDF